MKLRIRHMALAFCIAFCGLTSCFDEIPPYIGGTGITGERLDPQTEQEFMQAIIGTWTFGAASGYQSLVLDDDMTYVLVRKPLPGKTGSYIFAGGYSVGGDMSSFTLSGVGTMTIGHLTTLEMGLTLTGESTKPSSMTAFRYSVASKKSPTGRKTASVAYSRSDDDPAYRKLVFGYEDGVLSSITEANYEAMMTETLGIAITPGIITISGNIIEYDGFVWVATPLDASIELNSVGLAVSSSWSLGDGERSGTAKYVYTAGGYLNAVAVFDGNGNMASGLAAMYSNNMAVGAFSSAYAGGILSTGVHAYTYDMGNVDYSNYLSTLSELFNSGSIDSYLSIGGWLGIGPQRPLTRADFTSVSGSDYVLYKYTFPSSGNVNYAERIDVVRPTDGDEVVEQVIMPYYYDSGQESLVEVLPMTEDDLKAAIIGIWEFESGSSYISLGLDSDMNYVLKMGGVEGGSEDEEIENTIYSGSYTIAADLQTLTLGGFGQIRLLRITKAGIRLVVMPYEETEGAVLERSMVNSRTGRTR